MNVKSKQEWGGGGCEQSHSEEQGEGNVVRAFVESKVLSLQLDNRHGVKSFMTPSFYSKLRRCEDCKVNVDKLEPGAPAFPCPWDFVNLEPGLRD